MEIRDFLITPLVIIGVYAIAYWLRPRLCDEVNYKYFFPALTVRIVGALFVGLLYQFFYGGGDTFNYHTHGSRIIWEAFMEDPTKGLSLLFSSSGPSLYRYSSRIIFYNDPGSFFVVKIAFLFDLLTFSTYSATATLFALFSFVGTWFFFRTFYDSYPHLKGQLALCILFLPSVFFWGSGVLKDTLVIGALGFATYTIKRFFIERDRSLLYFVVLLASLFVIFEIKKYVLLCFLPSAVFWVYGRNLQNVRSKILKIMLLPFIVSLTLVTGIFVVVKVGENDKKYAIDRLAETARVTAYDIGFYSGRGAGSTYSLGNLDGSFTGMISVFPEAVVVSLFRPFLWEVKNPLMLLSALEAFVILVITLKLSIYRPRAFFAALSNPTVIFCMLFAVTFAFGVGVSTYNFGTLSRYKIPLLPFYLVGLVLISDYKSNKERKAEELELTE